MSLTAPCRGQVRVFPLAGGLIGEGNQAVRQVTELVTTAHEGGAEAQGQTHLSHKVPHGSRTRRGDRARAAHERWVSAQAQAQTTFRERRVMAC